MNNIVYRCDFHIKFMTKNNIYKICTIMTTGRTGSDYLAGCLDGVKNIIVFSGKFNHQIFFKDHKQKIKKEILISKFISENKKLFTYNKIENLRLNININNFKKKFIEISTNTLNRKEFFIKLYEAYHLTLNRKLLKSNVIVHHSHGRTNTSNFLKDFPNAKILITIRDPRANLKSGLLNWFKFDPEKKHMMHVFMYLRRIRNDLNYALKNTIKAKNLGTKWLDCTVLGMGRGPGNTKTEELIVCDYKSQHKTSKVSQETYFSDPYKDGYKRQLDFYAYLLKNMGFKVSSDAYLYICNAIEVEDGFHGKMLFDEILIQYDVQTDYLDEDIQKMIDVMNSNRVPESNDSCENCAYARQRSSYDKI